MDGTRHPNTDSDASQFLRKLDDDDDASESLVRGRDSGVVSRHRGDSDYDEIEEEYFSASAVDHDDGDDDDGESFVISFNIYLFFYLLGRRCYCIA